MEKIGLQKQKVQQLEQQKKESSLTLTSPISGEKTTILTDKPIKKETKSKIDDEKLLTAVVTLKNSKNGVANSSVKKRELVNQSKDCISTIKRRSPTLRGKDFFYFSVTNFANQQFYF